MPGTAERAYLFADDTGVELSVYPADILSQARAFYTRPTAVAALLALDMDPAWSVKPNFHFGHMEAGYVWTDTKRPWSATSPCGRKRSAIPAP